MIECYKWIPKYCNEHFVYYYDIYNTNSPDAVKVQFDTLEDLLKDADSKLFVNITLDKYALVISKYTGTTNDITFKAYGISIHLCRACIQKNNTLDYSGVQRYYIDNGTIDSVIKVLKSHMKNEETIINEDYD